MLNKQEEQVIEKVIKNVVIYYELGRILVIDLDTKNCKRLAIIDKGVVSEFKDSIYKS